MQQCRLGITEKRGKMDKVEENIGKVNKHNLFVKIKVRDSPFVTRSKTGQQSLSEQVQFNQEYRFVRYIKI